jgi:hypothetical protein
MKTNRVLFVTFIVISMTAVLHSCYYDQEAYLYGVECDNTAVTYNSRIKAIADSKCATAGCHSGPSPSNDLSFEGYEACKSSTQNSDVMCTIKRLSGCSPMPKNNSPLSQCDIDAWQIWIDNGYPN